MMRSTVRSATRLSKKSSSSYCDAIASMPWMANEGSTASSGIESCGFPFCWIDRAW